MRQRSLTVVMKAVLIGGDRFQERLHHGRTERKRRASNDECREYDEIQKPNGR
jgi:hypothetical protein